MSDSAIINIALSHVADINPESLGTGTPGDFRFSYIDLGSVTRGTINWKNVPACEFRIAPSRARRVTRGGDVLFGTVRPSLESHASIPPTAARAEFIASTGFAVIRAKRGISDARFLYHYCFSDAVRQEARRAEVGSNYPAVNESDLARFNFPDISLVEQRQIAQILDALDQETYETERIIAKLKVVGEGLLDDLITRGVDSNGKLRNPEQHPEQFQDSRLGRIPSMWRVLPAQDVCIAVIDCKNRTPPLAHDGHPVIRTSNVRNGGFVSDGLAFTDAASYEIWTQRGKPRPGDVLITREAPVGEVCLLPRWLRPACLGQRMMMYRPDPSQLDNGFMVVAILSRPVQKILLDLAGGSTVGHVRVGDIRKLPIPVPPLEEQKRIVSVWTSWRNRLASEEALLSKLRSLKKGLMSDLLTGRVRAQVELVS